MVRKKDFGKVFFIYLCLFHVCPAHPCGQNPMRGIITLAERTGMGLLHLLDTVRSANSDMYQRLERDWRVYAKCVGMVDTGYFKRSSSSAPLALPPQDRSPASLSPTSTRLRQLRLASSRLPLIQTRLSVARETMPTSFSTRAPLGRLLL